MKINVRQLLVEAGVLTEMSGAILYIVKHMGRGHIEADGMIRVGQMSPFDVKEAFINHELKLHIRDEGINNHDFDSIREIKHKLTQEYGKVQIPNQELRSKHPSVVYTISGPDVTVWFSDKPPRVNSK